MNKDLFKILGEFEDELTCCITYKIFYNPIVANDGYTF